MRNRINVAPFLVMLLRTGKASLAAAFPWAACVGLLTWAMLASGRYDATPALGQVQIVKIALAACQASLALMAAASFVLVVSVALLCKAVGRPLREETTVALTLACAPVAFLVPLIGLWANVSVLRYRYSPISIATDVAIVLVGLAALFAGARLLAARPILLAPARSSALGIAGLVALLAPFLVLPAGNAGASRKADPIAATTARADSTAPAAPLGAATEPTGWNFLFLSLDTLRPDHLGSYGYERPVSPNLDRLAAEGVRMANAYSHAPWTLPSHNSMVTGRYPSAHGSMRSPVFVSGLDVLSDSNITLAEVLEEAGYATAAFTSSPMLGEPYGFDQGFQEIDYRDRGQGMRGRWEEGKRWLDTVSGRPFFLMLHSYDIHNYDPPDDLKQRFVRPYEGPLLELYARPNALRYRIVSSGFFSLSDDDVRFLSDLYDATIADVDRIIGEMIDHLRKRGDWDRTLIVITSDHGEEFFEHGGTGHGFTLYDEQLRVPLILGYPNDPSGTVVPTRVRLIDLMPTVLDLLGLPSPTTIQGKSFVPEIRGERTPDRPVFAEATHIGNSAALISGQLKLVRQRYLSGDLLSTDQLVYNLRQILTRSPDRVYDLAVDPGEHDRLSGRSHSELGDQLESLREANARIDAGTADETSPMEAATMERLRTLGYLE